MAVQTSVIEFRHDTGYGDQLLNHINSAIRGKDMLAVSVVDIGDAERREIERLKAHVAQLQEVERTLRAVVRGVEVLAYNFVDNADGRLGPQCNPPCPENGYVRNETTIHVAQQLTKVVGALLDRNRT